MRLLFHGVRAISLTKRASKKLQRLVEEDAEVYAR